MKSRSMTPADTLIALIARVESASGPDRELDLMVLRAHGGNGWYWLDRERETITRDKYGRGALGNPACSLDHYTASLDAAVTLVPEGYTGMVHLDGKASLYRDDMQPTIDSLAATPALALVAAALRARAQEVGDE